MKFGLSHLKKKTWDIWDLPGVGVCTQCLNSMNIYELGIHLGIDIKMVKCQYKIIQGGAGGAPCFQWSVQENLFFTDPKNFKDINSGLIHPKRLFNWEGSILTYEIMTIRGVPS